MVQNEQTKTLECLKVKAKTGVLTTFWQPEEFDIEPFRYSGTGVGREDIERDRRSRILNTNYAKERQFRTA